MAVNKFLWLWILLSFKMAIKYFPLHKANTKNMKLKNLLIPVILVFTLAACKTGEKLALKLNYEKGKKYYYTSINDQAVEQTVMGKTVKTKNKTTTGYIWEVKDIDKDGNFIVLVTYDKVETQKEGEGANQPSPLKDDFMKGFSFEMTVTPKGKVTEVRGMDKMMDAAFAQAMPDSVAADPMMGQVKEMLKKQFSDKSMGSMMSQMTDYFPEGEVEVGDKWEKTVDVSTLVPMKITSTYMIKDIKDGVAIVEVESKVEPGKGEAMMGMEIKMNGTQKGTMEVNTKNGLVQKSDLDQDMSGEVGMMGMSFPMKITGKVTVEAKEMN